MILGVGVVQRSANLKFKIQLQLRITNALKGPLSHLFLVPIVDDQHELLIERGLNKHDPVVLVFSMMRAIKEVDVKLSYSSERYGTKIAIDETNGRVIAFKPAKISKKSGSRSPK